jgi:hypothetical protein
MQIPVVRCIVQPQVPTPLSRNILRMIHQSSMALSEEDEDDDDPTIAAALSRLLALLSNWPPTPSTRSVLGAWPTWTPSTTVLYSESDADGGVDAAQPTRLENEHDVGLEPAPQTSTHTARKKRTGGKRNSTTTAVSKPSQRYGVMNRKSASRDESPPRRRRPSFDTTPSARRSSFEKDNQRADDAGAAPTYSDHPGDM